MTVNEPLGNSLLDCEFYKLLVSQYAFKYHKLDKVIFQVFDKNQTVLTQNSIDLELLEAELDKVSKLRLQADELIWLAQIHRDDGELLFSKEFISYLSDLSLPAYRIIFSDGHYRIQFEGRWSEVTFWESYALSAIKAIYFSQKFHELSLPDRKCFFFKSRANNVRKFSLAAQKGLQILDYSTRRRLNFPWHLECLESAAEHAGDSLLGCSNTLMCMKLDIPLAATIPHEISMVEIALSPSVETLRRNFFMSFYRWKTDFGEQFSHILPDAILPSDFFSNAPRVLSEWKSVRIDSGDPLVEFERTKRWWKENFQDPRDKHVVFSDALTLDRSIHLAQQIGGYCNLSFAWGSHFSNDQSIEELSLGNSRYSVVCKPTSANNMPTIKQSADERKNFGPPDVVKALSDAWR